MVNVFLWLFCNPTQGMDIANINDGAVPNGYQGSNSGGAGGGVTFINGVYSQDEVKVQCFEKRVSAG